MRATWVALILVACGGGDDTETVDASRGPDAAPIVDAAPPDATPPAVFGTPIPLSDPANASFLPAIASRGDVVVVAWHDFPGGPSRVVTRAIVAGVPGPIEPVPETLDGPKRPSLATTTSGFVLSYDATDTSAGISVIRTIDLDADGHALGAPTTVSAPGVLGVVSRVAASGDDVAFAWTDGTAHYVARRGPVETVAAVPVGTTLQSTGQLNFPRIAVTSAGELLLAYRDGGTEAIDWDVLLVAKSPGGAFGAPVNISNTPNLLSDDISLALEPDDTLDLVWVDQDPVDVNSFEVTFATRDAAGAVTAHDRFGTQGEWAWTPSAIAGLTAAWHTGGGAGGALWLGQTRGAPEAILAGETGGMVALARDDAGALHLCYVTPAAPRQVMYARTP
jgi:hypothetical protein